MKNVTTLAIDIAKNVFQLHGTDKSGKAILKKKITRTKLLEFVTQLPACNIYMEGCGSANYWGREFQRLGHKVKLINPKYVKPYVKRNKNDMNDAAGIVAAARDPDMRFSEVKTIEQQDVQSLHRIRKLVVQQRTSLANQIRGILAEYGVVMARGVNKIRSHLVEILGENPTNLSARMLHGLTELYDTFKYLDEYIARCDGRITALFRANATCKKLATIPGVGELSATILASMLGTGVGFKNGRHFAAFLGLVPKQHSSGSKERLLGISKGGDTYMRALLVHGARTVLLWASKKTDQHSVWLKNLALRSGKNKAVVAMANKMARMAWALVRFDTEYDANYKPILFAKSKS